MASLLTYDVMRHGGAFLVGVAFGLGLATPSRAQDLFEMFGTGTDAKLHAGAGILASRGPAANYYNPANLSRTKQRQAYGELDIMNFSYTYAYPDLEPITISRTTPLPFAGVVLDITRQLSFGFSFLPLPASSKTQDIAGLPTRRVMNDPAEDEPLIVSVEQKGASFGYRLSLGAGYDVASGFALGASVLVAAESSTTTARDAETDAIISDDATSTRSIGILLGARSRGGRLQSAVTLKIPSSTTLSGHTEVPPLGDDAYIEKAETLRGPLGFGLGISYKIDDCQPYFEFVREQWSALREQQLYSGSRKAQVDYFDTNDIKIGFDYFWKVHRFTAAVATYQSHLGDGIMEHESVSDTEVIGMEFQNIDAIPYRVFAGGYRRDIGPGGLQAGLSYLNGERSVWEKARGYGTYKLKIITVILGGNYKF